MPTVIIYWSPGRTQQQKERVVEKITAALVDEGGANRGDVLIVFQNIEAGDAARAGQILNAPHLPVTLDTSPQEKGRTKQPKPDG